LEFTAIDIPIYEWQHCAPRLNLFSSVW